MKNLSLLLTLLISVPLLNTAQATVVYEDDFSAYSSGVSIAGPNWDPKADGGSQEDLLTGSGNVGGAYYAVLDGLAERAYYAPSKTGFNPGGTNTTVISSDFRYSHLSGGTITNFFNQPAFGILLTTTPAWNTGVNKDSPFINRGAAIGLKLPLAPWQEGWVTHSSLGVNTSTGGTSDWFSIELTLTPSNGTLWIKSDLLSDAGDILVVGSVIDSGLADTNTLYAGYSTGWNSSNLNIMTFAKFDEIHVDNFKIEFPEPPMLPITNSVDVTVDLTHQLYIGGVSAFSRDRVINMHGTGPKNGSGGFSADEAAFLIDTNKVGFGRSVGGFTWVRNQVQDEDPSRPGYINTNSLASWCSNPVRQDGLADDWPWIKTGYQPLIYTDHTSVHPDDNGNTGIFNPTNNEAAAEWAATVWANYWTAPKRPRYYEPVNEPFVHIANKQNVVDFYDAVIDRMHQDVPDVKVGGPCMAFPAFSNSDYGLFTDRMGRYIDQVGDTTDFLSWHIYSTFYDDGDAESHGVGAHGDWQLDLVENYAFNETGREIPIVISEFGGGYKNWDSGSTVWDTYTDLRDWYTLKSVMGKTMMFYERPDRVEKALPFIVEKSTWYSGYETNPYAWVSYRWNGSGWVATHLPKFFEFWKEVEGDRFPVATTDPDLQAHAFVTNTTVHLCLNNIDAFAPSVVDIAALFESGMSVLTSTVTRLYWDGAAPVLESHAAMGSWSNITLQAEEAAIIHLTLSQIPSREFQLFKKSHYGDRTIVAYSGTPENFTINADMNRGAINKAELKIGVTRDFGTDFVPIVTFNGNALTPVTDWAGGTQEGVTGGAGGRDQFDGTIRMDVPTHLIEAINTVDVSFATTGGYIATAILDVTSELPFDFNIVAQADPTDLIMSWDSSSSFDYAVKKSVDLPSDVWMTVVTLNGTGGSMSYTNSYTDTEAFYKVEAVNP